MGCLLNLDEVFDMNKVVDENYVFDLRNSYDFYQQKIYSLFGFFYVVVVIRGVEWVKLSEVQFLNLFFNSL